MFPRRQHPGELLAEGVRPGGGVPSRGLDQRPDHGRVEKAAALGDQPYGVQELVGRGVHREKAHDAGGEGTPEHGTVGVGRCQQEYVRRRGFGDRPDHGGLVEFRARTLQDDDLRCELSAQSGRLCGMSGLADHREVRRAVEYPHDSGSRETFGARDQHLDCHTPSTCLLLSSPSTCQM